MFRNLLISSFDATIRVKRAFHPAPALRGFASHVFLVIIPREARAEGPSVARLINLSGRAGPSGAKPREFERKIYLLRSTKENASLISFLRPVSFEMVCLCTAMQNFSRLL